MPVAFSTTVVALGRIWAGGTPPSSRPLVNDRNTRLRLLPEATCASVRAVKLRFHVKVCGAITGRPGPDRCPPGHGLAAHSKSPFSSPHNQTSPLKQLPRSALPGLSVRGIPHLPVHCVSRAWTLPAHCSKPRLASSLPEAALPLRRPQPSCVAMHTAPSGRPIRAQRAAPAHRTQDQEGRTGALGHSLAGAGREAPVGRAEGTPGQHI